MLTLENKIDEELINEDMTEKKIHNKEWKKIKVETVKVKKSLTNIPLGNITEANLCRSETSLR